jgi:hypothetical protein
MANKDLGAYRVTRLDIPASNNGLSEKAIEKFIRFYRPST